MSQNSELDIKHLKLILKRLSQIQVRSLKIVEECSNIIENETWIKESFFNMMEYIDQCSLIKIDKQVLCEKFENRIEKINSKKINSQIKVDQFVKSVRHQVTFEYENNEPKDCEFINVSPLSQQSPIYDVLFVIYSTTSREFRKKHLKDLINFYFESFKQELEQDSNNIHCFTFEYQEYLKTVRQFIPLLKIISAITKFQFIKEHNLFDSYISCMIDAVEELEEYLTNEDSLLVLPDDLEEIIKSNFGCQTIFNINGYVLEPLDQNLGAYGRYYNLKVFVKIQEVKELNYFVKMYPHGSHFLEFEQDSSFFNKEILFFADIITKMKQIGIKDIDDCLPNCHLTYFDDIIVFENITKAQQFKSINKRHVFTDQEIRTVLKTLAKFHACSLYLEEKLNKDSKEPKSLVELYHYSLKESNFNKEHSSKIYKGMLLTAKTFTNMLKNEPDETFSKFILDLFELSKRLLCTVKFKKVICHGDLTPSNILIKYDDSGHAIDCRLVDLQMNHYTVPGFDVLFFLVYSTTHQDRKTCLDRYIKYYFEELICATKSNGLSEFSLISYEEFIDGCNYIYPVVIFQAATWQQVGLASEEVFQSYLETGNNLKDFLCVDRKTFIDIALAKDAVYREKMNEMIELMRLIFQLNKNNNKNVQYLKELYGIISK